MSSSTGFAICCFAFLLGSTAGNMVSPGLQKCLDIKAELKDDGKTRETAEDMNKKDSVNVQLYKCHDKPNQDWELIDGQIKSDALDDRCLTVEGEAKKNANVHLAKCGGDNQKWDFTGKSYIQLQGTKLCLDVKAKKTDDGYEKFEDIKKHKSVNVQLYDCHDPDTKRVNQLWEFAPISGGQVVSAWELPSNFILKSNTSGIGSMALATAGMASLFAAGVFIGLRMRKSTVQQPMANLELE